MPDVSSSFASIGAMSFAKRFPDKQLIFQGLGLIIPNLQNQKGQGEARSRNVFFWLGDLLRTNQHTA